jgi:hypothetical protein
MVLHGSGHHQKGENFNNLFVMALAEELRYYSDKATTLPRSL